MQPLGTHAGKLRRNTVVCVPHPLSTLFSLVCRYPWPYITPQQAHRHFQTLLSRPWRDRMSMYTLYSAQEHANQFNVSLERVLIFQFLPNAEHCRAWCLFNMPNWLLKIFLTGGIPLGIVLHWNSLYNVGSEIPTVRDSPLFTSATS